MLGLWGSEPWTPCFRGFGGSARIETFDQLCPARLRRNGVLGPSTCYAGIQCAERPLLGEGWKRGEGCLGGL